MVPGLALGVLTASILTWRPTIEIKASSVKRTLAVIDTLSSATSDERVAPVTSWTGADRSISSGSVKASLTLSPWTTRVWCAQVLLLKWTTADERIASVPLGAGADSLVVGGLAGRPGATHIGVGIIAGVTALELDTGLVAGAVIVTRALCVTARVRVAQEVRRTRALGSVVDGLAIGILSTRSSAASILTPVMLPVASLAAGTLAVTLALVTAPGQRIANVGGLAPANRPVIRSNLAISVGTTRSADLITGKSSTVSEWISGGSAGTSADGHMVLHCAL